MNSSTASQPPMSNRQPEPCRRDIKHSIAYITCSQSSNVDSRAEPLPERSPSLCSRSSTVESWAESLPERSTSTVPSDQKTRSQDPTVEAYRRLKMALFFKNHGN
ncbi:hypothetical protein BU16DRAFT_559868 [Lophium mytilinum]|uniref:Uncharacterized protein n=1 Tax=Lophium mytilinum TaxID=390894 RepID=A0A6A6QY29_9PEZI|nr:hypothetical protein BU16DRAFT_559868 [Lophium mytilinum]